MNLARCEDAIRAMAHELLDDTGFKETDALVFAAVRGRITRTISFVLRLDSNACYFTFNLGIGIEEVNAILSRVGMGLGSHGITAMIPIHFLYDGRKHFEWRVDSKCALEPIKKEVCEAIVNLAVPWWDKYSILDAIRNDLESSNPSRWFLFGPEQRLLVLAAIWFVKGKREEAKEIIDRALDDRKDSTPSKRRGFEQFSKAYF